MMNTFKKLLTTALALSMILTGLLAFASCEKAPEGEFVVGLDDAFPPMGYRDADNNIVGFDIDLATEAAKRMNMTVKFQPIAWASKDMELDTGNISCVWNGFTMHVDTRDDDYTWTPAYMKSRQVLVVLADSPYQSADDLAGKNLALQLGSSAEAALDGAADFKASLGNIAAYDDNQKVLMDLEIKQSDAILIDEPVVRYYISQKEGGAENYRIFDTALADEEYGVGFKLGNTELRDKVVKALEEMAKDGTMKKISEKWFGSDVTTIGK